ncbi:hypothetical protein COU57_03620 [Candidatus Pacearchaeota archaeon CG10_big_fil_rev_8_21_14_0_10_32_14]|nr:MAG: hypothetical protein COU57_03620 [Candidatus Pacearchaeota archaeon CG10_big_fil_rev_8_21_14_0_10_32_14]
MESYNFNQQIEIIGDKFLLKIQEKKQVNIISHFDTDGITSATIIIKTLKEIDVPFTLKILKNLDEKFIFSLPKDEIILFTDLASGSLHHIENSNLNKENIFIIDHHEIPKKFDESLLKSINILNPQLGTKEQISSSGLAYLFSKQILKRENKDLAKLAVLGMVGDSLEKNINKLNNNILRDGEIVIKQGLLLYPSTRSLNWILEFNSSLYIPGVTGNNQGTVDLLKEAGLHQDNGRYKSLIELNQDEMEKLTTCILLRLPKKKHEEIIGDIFLIKLFNKLEDARELSALINATSRQGEPETAIKFCLELSDAKKRAETLYAKKKRMLLSGLDYVVNTCHKIEGNGYVIINVGNKIPESIIGTIASVLSHSSIYSEGTIITTMAYYENENKIKVSSRSVGNFGRNVREILESVINETSGEVGGHEFAAGAIIDIEKEDDFIELLRKNLELEVIKI